MIDFLLQPLTWGWLILIGGAIQLWRAGSRRWGVGMGGMALVLWAIGGTPLSGWLLAGLERPYATSSEASGGYSWDAVVVLGGGHGVSAWEMAGFYIDAAYERPITGVTLVGQGATTNLVFGGGFQREGDRFLESGEAQVRWWRSRLPDGVRMHVLSRCKTTREEAVRAAELAQREGWTRVALVTSASHMPRALAAFEGVGMRVTPVGCDFAGLARMERRPGFTVVPTTGDLDLFVRWAHEVVGRGYYWLRRWG